MDQRLLEGFPVVVEQAVAWGEMDAFAHVNNVVYFRYFENARLEYFRRIAWLDLMEQIGIGPIVASTHARFRRAVKYPDTVQIGARITSIGDDRFTMEHRIASTTQAAVVTEGEAIVVAYDYRGNTKTPIPVELRRRIESLEGRA
jgi:acyl-CoA thioester hydrolase